MIGKILEQKKIVLCNDKVLAKLKSGDFLLEKNSDQVDLELEEGSVSYHESLYFVEDGKIINKVINNWYSRSNIIHYFDFYN